MTIKKIIAIIVGILLVAFGIYTYDLGKSGLGDINYYCGELKFEAGTDTGAYDDTFNVYIDSPFLMRKVEMVQFVGNADKGVRLEYSDAPESVTNDTGFYNNPPFPEFPKSKNFYGLLSIAGQKIYLSEPYLDKLSYKSYVNFKREGKLYPVSGLAKGKTISGLYPLDDHTYIPKGAEEAQLGDIRVTWYTIDPADLTGDYTAAGMLVGTVLEEPENGVFFYDYKVSEKELRASFEDDNIIVGIVMTIIGLLCIGIPILLARMDKKEMQSKENQI